MTETAALFVVAHGYRRDGSVHGMSCGCLGGQCGGHRWGPFFHRDLAEKTLAALAVRPGEFVRAAVVPEGDGEW